MTSPHTRMLQTTLMFFYLCVQSLLLLVLIKLLLSSIGDVKGRVLTFKYAFIDKLQSHGVIRQLSRGDLVE